MPIPQLVAHRGYTLHFPENTLPGVEAAIRAGARHVEIDVQLSRDRVPMLFHDQTLERICGVAGAIHQRDLHDLQTLRASEPGRFGRRFEDVRLATLAELAGLIGQHAGVTAFVELKRISIEMFGVETVLERMRTALDSVLGQCVLISFELEALLLARSQGWPTLGGVIDRWEERTDARLQRLQPRYLFCNLRGLPPSGRIELPGAHVVVFEVADAQIALDLAERGVEFIETFAFGELHRDLRAAVR
jgi:glycerophosphoryl diester phosphodiesterase